jgi:hypothetical protein
MNLMMKIWKALFGPPTPMPKPISPRRLVPAPVPASPPDMKQIIRRLERVHQFMDRPISPAGQLLKEVIADMKRLS